MNAKQVMDQIISVFENSTTELQYDYVEDLGDGRGYTCGRAGFTTSDGDALGVIKRYLEVVGNATLGKFVDRLQKLCDENSDATFWLKLGGFPSAWREAAIGPLFRAAQDQINDEEYYTPAVEMALKCGITSPLGQLCFYDTCVQHGLSGPDSLTQIAGNALSVQPFGEAGFLASFLSARRTVLLFPHDPSTATAWKESVGRVDTLKALLAAGNYSLQTPFKINPYGDSFTIGDAS